MAQLLRCDQRLAKEARVLTVLSAIMWVLDRRKDARKRAAKARRARADLRGGW